MGEHVTGGDPHVRDLDCGTDHPGGSGHRGGGAAYPVTLPSFEEACAATPGRIGDVDGAAEAVCQLYHGMSLEEWRALPEGDYDYEE